MISDRDRVLKSIKWDNPNSLIVEGGFSPATWMKYREELEPIAAKIANDFYKYRGPKNDYDEMPASYRKGDSFKDAWGCVWECKVNGMQGIITHHPLGSEWEGFDSFLPPDPDRTADLTAWNQKAFEDDLKIKVQDKKFIMGGSGERLWERVHFIHGYENTMIDLAMGDSRIRRLIDMIVEYNIKSIDKFLKYDEVDCIVFQDDWGEQFRLMISPEMWREYFYEGYRKVFQTVRQAGKYVYFHTDGYLLPIVPDLIKAGANIINLQSGSHRLEDLREACLNKVCLSVDIDRQKVMPFGTPEEMKNHIREIYKIMEAWKGGVWVKMDVYPDTPMANIRAMCEVFEELRANA